MQIPKEQLDAFIASLTARPVEQLTRIFLSMRDASAAATRSYEADKAQFKAIMTACENLMLARADAQGVSGFKTEAATTFTTETVRVSVADPTAFAAFLDSLPADGDRYGFWEQRVSSRRVEDYLKTHGVLPPGLNVFRERVMRVRQAADK